jgi:hypothetical protein
MNDTKDKEIKELKAQLTCAQNEVKLLKAKKIKTDGYGLTINDLNIDQAIAILLTIKELFKND